MIFITAASKSFRPQFNCLKASLGDHKSYVFDLGGLGEGIRFPVTRIRRQPDSYTPHSPFKPDLIRYATEMLIPENELFCWLDADTELLRYPDELETMPFDIAVTWNGKYINAGVMFFRNTPTTRDFILDWQYWTGGKKSDEMVLNSMLCLFEYGKLEVVHLNRDVYNSDSPSASIRHYEGDKHRDLLL